ARRGDLVGCQAETHEKMRHMARPRALAGLQRAPSFYGPQHVLRFPASGWSVVARPLRRIALPERAVHARHPGRKTRGDQTARSSSRRTRSPMSRVEIETVFGCRISAVRAPDANPSATAFSTRSASSPRSKE